MNKMELTRDIREAVGGGGMITKNQLAKYLHISRSNNMSGDISQYLEGLSYIPDGRGRKYFIPDVAGKILERSVRG